MFYFHFKSGVSRSVLYSGPLHFMNACELSIAGMTCESCSLLLEQKIGVVPGVAKVKVSHRTGKAKIWYTGKKPSKSVLATTIRSAGYDILDESNPVPVKAEQHKWLKIGAALIIVFAIAKVLQVFDLVSLAPATSGALTVGGIFLIGLVAGTSSCLAVTGGLLLAVAAKYNEAHEAHTKWEKMQPLLQFNIGRLASYFVLGGVVGLAGQSLTLSAPVTGILTIIIAFVMLYLALSILQIVPKGMLSFRPPQWLSTRILALSEQNHPAAPFALGACTFFLPCGFTQSLQIAALASGSFATGAVIMGTFALGTLPALLGISALSASMTGKKQEWFLRFSGAAVMLLSLVNLQSGLVLAGAPVPSFGLGPAVSAVERGGVQEISMKVTPYSYMPGNLTVKAGIPVRWNIDATDASGCTGGIVVPSLGINQTLARGMNVIEFTPTKKGKVAFTCTMGMVSGSFTVL